MLSSIFKGLRNTGISVSLFLLIPLVPAIAGDDWKVTPVVTSSAASGPVPERRMRAPSGGLPDGLVASLPDGDIRKAWYGAPTKRYGHAVLGDGIEAGSLLVTTADNETLELVLPKTEVFEDRYPRLADLDNDGVTEVITIRSSLSDGASVAIYALQNGQLVERASTGFIGRANRWLNIAGIADFDGRPGLEIAFVRTPHIGGTLFFFSYADGSLSQVGAMDGFSNHFIGSRELRLSAGSDVNNDGRTDLALPSDDRRTLLIVGFGDDGPAELAQIPLHARIDKAIGVEGGGQSTVFVVGLEDGSMVRISR
ncbi:MAG: hypothetical protein NXI27_25550 [Alphaproteobacteria bacterium]|nr:hypothetical protein [Alphaproteobacteria bacterium]